MRRLTVLVTNIWLDTYAGSEVVTRDLAIGLLRRGHRVIVYSPRLGPVAQELRSKGIAVTDDLRSISEPPDIIHGHHTIPCAEAIIEFPKIPAINVCHAFEHWVEAPVHFSQVFKYIAVDEACRDRLVHVEGIPAERVRIAANCVDLARIPQRLRPLPERPKLALAFGKASAVGEIREACEKSGIELRTLGYQVKRTSCEPEKELVGVDLVFGSARAALEGLCCGCAVIACDGRGMAGMVRSENFSLLRERNFGLRSLGRPMTVENVLREIEAYDRVDAERVSKRARSEADHEHTLDFFEALYADAIAQAGPVSDRVHKDELSRFLRQYLPRLPGDPRWPWQAERENLLARLRQCDEKRQLAENKVPELQDQIAQWRTTAENAIDRMNSTAAQTAVLLRDQQKSLAALRRYNRKLEAQRATSAACTEDLAKQVRALEAQHAHLTEDMRRAKLGRDEALDRMRAAEGEAALARQENQALRQSMPFRIGRWFRRSRPVAP